MLPLRHQTAGMVVGNMVVIVAVRPGRMGMLRLIALPFGALHRHDTPPQTIGPPNEGQLRAVKSQLPRGCTPLGCARTAADTRPSRSGTSDPGTDSLRPPGRAATSSRRQGRVP